MHEVPHGSGAPRISHGNGFGTVRVEWARKAAVTSKSFDKRVVAEIETYIPPLSSN